MLESALREEKGILVETTDTEILKRKLYTARRDAQAKGISIFDDLSFRIDPRNPKTRLLILKKDSAK